MVQLVSDGRVVASATVIEDGISFKLVVSVSEDQST
jgi:hypothetical protein